MFIQDLLMLFENKEEYVVKNFGEKLVAASRKEMAKKDKLDKPEDVVERLKAADPKSKNLVWIARMYAAGEFKFEDLARMKDELEKFEKVKSKLPNKDLNSYKNLGDLYAAIDTVKPEEAKSEREKEKELKGDVTWLIRSPEYKALIPKTKEASCIYGAGTRWCTAATGSHNYFDSYSKQGDLIIIIAKVGGKDRKFQLHYESGSFMDENDRPVTQDSPEVAGLSKHPEHAQLINMLIAKHYVEVDK